VTHQCPRPECSRSVPDDMFACRGDWYALPEALRQSIWRGWTRGTTDEHHSAMSAALDWYREHPPRYATRDGMALRHTRERK